MKLNARQLDKPFTRAVVRRETDDLTFKPSEVFIVRYTLTQTEKIQRVPLSRCTADKQCMTAVA